MKKHATVICGVIYLLTVTLIFSVISILCNVETVKVSPTQDGMVDLTRINFNQSVVEISTEAALIYDGAFYTPKDFASGDIIPQGTRKVDTSWVLGDFGTVRFELLLPPDRVYAISSKSAAYAQRLFINGEEYNPVGVTGNNPASVTPKSTRYTEAFEPKTNTTEIILHYSNFVHPDGGSLYAPKLGTPDNISRVDQLKTFQVVIVTGALFTAMLFFFGLFLFFPKIRYLLWFSLVCGCIALRGLLTGDKLGMLLLPSLSWYMDIRLEYLLSCGLILFSVLYLNALFPGMVHRQITNAFILFCVGNAIFFSLTPPILFTRFVWFSLAVSIAYFLYALIRIVTVVIRKKNPTILSAFEQMLLPGVCMYLILSGFEIYAHENALYLWGLDFAQVGMLMFLFLNILALLLQFSRARQELDEARQSEREMEETNRMLERLDKLKTDFLSNISHEMRTPLMVMSGYAQLTQWQLNAGTTNEETQENLHIVSQEAQRLAELAAGLLQVSSESAWGKSTVNLHTIFERAHITCYPILKKNNNRLETVLEQSLPLMQANENMLFQVLLNLIVNANRHTQNGVICLRAYLDNKGHIVVTVEDNGEGIQPNLLPYVFDRQVSGDGGSGLGLSICKDVIEAHGGQICAVNQPSGGAQVSFSLPLNPEQKKKGEETKNEPKNPVT
ncbi:sensor histidine kinase [Scatolibacter rhodanostii]|uniref:sensor histidine kinase n=1 Tax=Scatolibacter rhodanostii TaxID=2014781 RepID=UPI000C07BA38|nr:sensor histidine kinase [Scatolibacter rhodanostii]